MHGRRHDRAAVPARAAFFEPTVTEQVRDATVAVNAATRVTDDDIVLPSTAVGLADGYGASP
jgi:hypothetical protein